jgi:hypothetical protein
LAAVASDSTSLKTVEATLLVLFQFSRPLRIHEDDPPEAAAPTRGSWEVYALRSSTKSKPTPIDPGLWTNRVQDPSGCRSRACVLPRSHGDFSRVWLVESCHPHRRVVTGHSDLYVTAIRSDFSRLVDGFSHLLRSFYCAWSAVCDYGRPAQTISRSLRIVDLFLFFARLRISRRTSRWTAVPDW